MGCVSGPSRRDCHARQSWAQCPSCGAPQLEFLVPLDLVYLGQHNAALGAVWRRHHERFLSFLTKISVGGRVVEVGGSTGSLGALAMATGRFASWTIVEPNPFGVPPGIKVVEGFVEHHPDIIRDADLVVHSHVLEHLYAPGDTLEAIGDSMDAASTMVFSVPNLPSLLTLNGANALNFEHTYYFDEDLLTWLLARTGFAVAGIDRFEGHSVFVHARPARPRGSIGPCPSGEIGAQQLEALLSRGELDAAALRARIDAETTRPVFLFGAHVFSQFLLAAGLDESGIRGVLDNDPAKQGERLYGTDLRVMPPSEVAGLGACVVIVRAAHYTDEITAQLRALNADADIW